MISINVTPTGTQPSEGSVSSAVVNDKIDKKIIINKILAVGIQRPEEAFNFLNTLDFADMVSVGIASEREAEETFGILNKI